MRILEITTTIKPLNPQQARVSALKQQKERVTTALKTERERQKEAKQYQKISQANQTLAKIRQR